MRKSDKKIDNQLRLVLTEVCDKALKDIAGFQWLTHTVNYTNFPQTLKVTCVFDTNENLNSYLQLTLNYKLAAHIHAEFKGIGIDIKNIKHHVLYDTEENCDRQHNSNWADRLC